MNVIRIPTKFSRPIKRLDDKKKLALFNALISIGDDEVIKLPDNDMGDLLLLIYGEWMNMESKNGKRVEMNHLAGDSAGDSEYRVEESIVEYSKIKENKIEIFKEKANQESHEPYPFFLYCFLDLGWKPGVNDTIESLQEWMRKTLKDGGIQSASDARQIMKDFHKYWECRKEEKGFDKKNWKMTLINSPTLPNNKNRYATSK